jgi:peptidoglycan/LPS O-acetylase OafA/YrhL
MTTSQPQKLYYPALDGLRGIGCLLVVVYHDFWFLQKQLFFGWLAMDIFFVLSGFLITDILLNTMGRENYLKNFYARRILRVFPLYYTSLIIFILILPHVNNLPFRLDYFVSHQAYFWLFLQNWVLIFDSPNQQTALNHLWSMAVEEQFYLLWPLLVAFIRKPKNLLLLVGALLLGFSVFRFWLWFRHVEGLAYYNFYLFTRIDGICIGCMVALLQKINYRFLGNFMGVLVLAFAGLNFIFYFINKQFNDSFPYLGLIGFSTFSMVFGLLVYDITNRRDGFFSKIFDINFLKFIGRISYGTYIFHWPIYLLINGAVSKAVSPLLSGQSNMLFTSTVATVVAYVAGYLSYRYFESYFLNMKKNFK